MGDRPIIFQGFSVRAILDGRKTVTRRTGPSWEGVPAGTALWVREGFAFPANVDALSPAAVALRAIQAGYSGPWAPTWYRGAGEYNRAVPEREAGERGRWRSPLHMPRWASRIRLLVESVTWDPNPLALDDAEAAREGATDAEAFRALWLEMHPQGGGAWRVQFRRADGGA